MVYLQVENVTRRYGELLLFERISFSIHKGEKVALIAKNGAGKTSLFNIIAGKDAPEEGEVIFRNNIRVGYLNQLPELNANNTVMQEVFASSGEMLKGIMQYEEAVESGDPGAYQQAIEEMDRLKAWDYEVKIKQILTRLKIDDLHQQVSVLSGGQQKRLALAKALIHEPDLLILDEPTNHLDLDMIEWLEEYLENTSLTLLMVTHDRYFLDNVCTHMIELDDQQIYTYKGNYSFYLEKREERLAAKQSGTDKAQNLLRKELEWIRRMPKARGHKAKYRVGAFQDLKEKASGQTTGKKMQMNVQVRRMGKKILEIKDLSKAYGDNVLLKDFSYTFSSQEKIGIIGKNGTGKTTLLHMITENILPDSGVLSKGETVTFGYYKQEGMSFREDQKVIEAVQDIAEVVTLSDGSIISASQFLSMFLFPPPMQYVYISKLSGGEKRRLYLLTVLMKNPNFLILDEPTNDLDILTLNVLEEYLENFPGCVLIVSHDRYFMDKLVDHLFVFEGNGKVKDFPGNYTQYRSSVKPEEPQKTDKPKEKKSTNKSILSAPKERKLTYKEKKELEKLEEEIATLEMEKTSLEEELASGDLSNELLTEKSLRIGVVLKQLEEKELRWLELSEYAL